MTRPAISETSWLSVRGRTVPWLVTLSGTSRRVTTFTRTPGGVTTGGWTSTGGRLRTIVRAARPATPSTASGPPTFKVRRSIRFMAAIRFSRNVPGAPRRVILRDPHDGLPPLRLVGDVPYLSLNLDRRLELLEAAPERQIQIDAVLEP